MKTILIEQVGNGYIVKENYRMSHHPAEMPRQDETKVFETTKGLTEYIEKDFNVELLEKTYQTAEAITDE